MSRNLALALLAAVLMAGAGYWWFQSQNSQKNPAVFTPTPTPTPTPPVEPDVTGEVDILETRKMVVEGDEYSFSPGSLSLKAGEKVSLTFKNTGKLPHNLVVNELGVSTKTVEGGGSDAVEFIASKTGSFKMYCSVGDHRARGMEGNFQVK